MANASGVSGGVAAAAAALADKWERWAYDRAMIGGQDSACRVLNVCASDLRDAIAEATDADAELTPAEFGALPHVGKSASQVRRWCRSGALVHRRSGRDYLIRRGADVPTVLA